MKNWKRIYAAIVFAVALPAIVCAVDFSIKGGTIVYKSGSITDDAISNSASISADKLKHIYKAGTNFQFVVGGTPTTKEETVFVASTAGTIRGFHFMLTDTGTSTSIAWDLKKNGTTVLTGTGSSTHADTDGQVKDGTLSSASFVADDRFTIVMTVTSATGAVGPYAWADFEESAP